MRPLLIIEKKKYTWEGRKVCRRKLRCSLLKRFRELSWNVISPNRKECSLKRRAAFESPEIEGAPTSRYRKFTVKIFQPFHTSDFKTF